MIKQSNESSPEPIIPRRPEIAVILTAYNEELTIKETIYDFHTALPEAAIWVIDNASTDKTNSIASDALANLNCDGGILYEPRKGKGNAVRRAFLEIEANTFVLADADLTYPANRARDLLHPVIHGIADMVVGDRHSKGHYSEENKRNFHDFGNRLVRDLVNRLFKAKLVDIMSGYRALSRRFVKNYPILVEGFEIETDMTLHALDKRFRILEIPIEYKDRPTGSFSKLNTFSDGTKVLFTIVRVLRYYRPLAFFGGCAVMFFLLAISTSVPVFNDWIREHYIRHLPLAVLSTGLVIVSVLMMVIGLILDSITEQDKRNFERDILNNTPDSRVPTINITNY